MTYSVKKLIQVFWKAILFVAVLAILGGGIMGVLAKKKQVTTNTSHQDILISHTINQSSSSNDGNDATNSLVMADMNMMPTYESVASSSEIAEIAHKRLPKNLKKKYSIKDIQSDVDAKSHQQSLILSINAKTKSASDSVKIAQSVAEAMKERLGKIQPGAGTVTILSRSSVADATSKTTPSAKKYAAAGIALGGLVGLIIVVTIISIKESRKK